jgi:hypothetical protein
VTLACFLLMAAGPVLLAAQFGPLSRLSVTWTLVLGGWALGWGWLGWRLSTVAIWLTFDSVVVRNVGRTRRLALTAITGMSFRGGTLTVATAWPATWVTLPAPVLDRSVPDRSVPDRSVPDRSVPGQPGRRAADGPRLTLRALDTGTARLTGRLCQADEAADAIAAAAGLPPLPPRRERVSLRLALAMAAAGLALLLVSQLLTHLSGVSFGDAELGSALSAPGLLLFFPALGVAADHLFHRAGS